MVIDWQRVADDLIARVSGPMHLRVFMQPAMAIFFGIRDGIKDAREQAPPYFWTLFSPHQVPGERMQLLKSGLHSVAKILVMAVLLDVIYQFIELHRLYLGEAIIVALVLAFVPYLLVRGPANRIARWWSSRRSPARTKYGTSR